MPWVGGGEENGKQGLSPMEKGTETGDTAEELWRMGIANGISNDLQP